jgi:hypothetical protein
LKQSKLSGDLEVEREEIIRELEEIPKRLEKVFKERVKRLKAIQLDQSYGTIALVTVKDTIADLKMEIETLEKWS